MVRNKVLEIKQTNERCGCNACAKREGEHYEMRFGYEGHASVIVVCKDCLNEFADKLWQALDE